MAIIYCQSSGRPKIVPQVQAIPNLEPQGDWFRLHLALRCLEDKLRLIAVTHLQVPFTSKLQSFPANLNYCTASSLFLPCPLFQFLYLLYLTSNISSPSTAIQISDFDVFSELACLSQSSTISSWSLNGFVINYKCIYDNTIVFFFCLVYARMGSFPICFFSLCKRKKP